MLRFLLKIAPILSELVISVTLNIKDCYRITLFCATLKEQEPIYEDNWATLISGFYRNNKVSHTILFLKSLQI